MNSRQKYFCCPQTTKYFIVFYRHRNSYRRESNQERKQRTNALNVANNIKSDNFIEGIREKSNIAIEILENV